jgi:hypothetical protein
VAGPMAAPCTISLAILNTVSVSRSSRFLFIVSLCQM